MKNIKKHLITLKFSIRDAVKHLDGVGEGFCVCVDSKKQVVGVITDGDFRRAIHNGIQLDENVDEMLNKDFFCLSPDYTRGLAEEIFENHMVRRIPILDERKLVGIIKIEEFYGEDNAKTKLKLKNPVVIMAGGEGTRLDPFTRILPKPLIPIGNDPVIKVIMDEFKKFGLKNFYISLRDKGRMIKAYFHDHELGYQIHYISENKPLGTAGALKHLEGKFEESFFVSNCDIIIRANYEDFYDFHKNGNFALSMVGSMQQYTIPYGVCELVNRGMLRKIREKPRYDFLVNTGLYLLEPEVLGFIPKETFLNMTDLIGMVQKAGLHVGVFPVSEKSWIDVGQLSEYKDIVNKLTLKEEE